uniref:Uncharacterized protein n=1 Tax=Arundo donax TaxID=35708 RepID=A0A0A9FEH0_ARUDO
MSSRPSLAIPSLTPSTSTRNFLPSSALRNSGDTKQRSRSILKSEMLSSA